MKLGTKQQQAIRALIELLGGNQKSFCSVNKISPSGLSAALKMDGDRGASDEIWNKIIAGLQDGLRQKQEDLRAKGRLKESQELMAVLHGAGSEVNTPYPPGGPLALDANNYIVRDADRRLKDVLSNKMGLGFLLGGVQSGRTSLLIRAEEWAADQKMEVATLDFNLVRAELDPVGGNVLELVGQALGLGLELGQTVSVNSFVAALGERLKAGANRLALLLDNMDALALDEGNMKIMPLVLAISSLRAKASRPGGAAAKLVTVCVFGAEMWNALHSSSFLAQGVEIHLSKLTVEQVSQLAYAVLGYDLPMEECRDLLGLFSGQPYLTHLYLEDRRQGLSPQEAAAVALRLGDAYRTHGDRLLRRLRTVVPSDGAYRSLLFDIAGRNREQPGAQLLRYDRVLQYFGIIEGDRSVSRFNAAVAERAISDTVGEGGP
jgi:hypothetical protein